MRPQHGSPRAAIPAAIFAILNPIPFGVFVGALIFDIVYLRTGEILWDKGAAWLIAIGLVFAVLPRLINLTQVWITLRRSATGTDRLDFFLHLAAIASAILNSFVHSRDAYASMPEGLWLSALTVLLLSIAYGVLAMRAARRAF